MLNLDSRTRSKLFWVASLLTPVLVVQGVRLAVGASSSPSAAGAATTGAHAAQPAPAPPESERPLSAAQAKARTWLLSRARTLQTRSPMDRADPTPVQVVIPDSTPIMLLPPPPLPDGPPTNLVLTGMIAGGTESQALASINHRVYRVGDTVVANWTITGIDTRKRIVTLAGPDGQTLQLAPATPAQDR